MPCLATLSMDECHFWFLLALYGPDAMTSGEGGEKPYAARWKRSSRQEARKRKRGGRGWLSSHYSTKLASCTRYFVVKAAVLELGHG